MQDVNNEKVLSILDNEYLNDLKQIKETIAENRNKVKAIVPQTSDDEDDV